ncbi:TrbC/VirB2 family protein [Massilia sp. R2A-15]|uniref:TrbC/VirB2 family protein n=1 Tax=Massilia sp. R2A-15 TaxID=3064278 RepID=UPI002734E6E8|nr:TrbC/VirB2 family protein [Massilia sp. R2A-15]WLI87827.1 TrbC/VirB2 family protein [Massilia sp. R2A-15]
MGLQKVMVVLLTDRFAKKYTIAILCGYAALLVASPAQAQSLRGTAEQIFNTIYGLVGVLGALSILVCAINWKMGNFLGTHDPKKMFVTSMIGTALAFGVVSIVSFIKGAVSASVGIQGV